MSTLSLRPAPTRRASSLLPRPSEVADALRDSAYLLRLRWRFMRTLRTRAMFLLAAGAFTALIFFAAQMGSIVRAAAEQGIDTPSGAFAVNYIIMLNHGELGSLGASVIGSVFFIAVINPFLGASVQALFPVDDLAGLRPSRLHRYFASLIANVVTVGGLFQLLMLTVLGSLLTLDGARTGGLLFMWSMWPAGLLLATFVAWTVEWVQRRYGPRARLGIGTVIGAIVTLAVLVDPNHGSTLFGLGNTVVNSVRAAASGDLTVVAASVAVATITSLALFLGGMSMCRAALALPDMAPAASPVRRIAPPISTRPTRALFQLVLAHVLRTPSIRRALITITVLGTAACFLTDGQNLMMTLVVGVPLMMALDFGANAFGILGPALPWLASQPRTMDRLFWIVAAAQISVTAFIGIGLAVLPTLLGKFTPADLLTFAAAFTVSTVLMSRSAMHKALHAPMVVRAGRNDPALPPTRVVHYAIRYVCWSGVGAVVVMGATGWVQAALVAMVVVWSLLRYLRLARLWQTPAVRARIIAAVAAT